MPPQFALHRNARSASRAYDDLEIVALIGANRGVDMLIVGLKPFESNPETIPDVSTVLKLYNLIKASP